MVRFHRLACLIGITLLLGGCTTAVPLPTIVPAPPPLQTVTPPVSPPPLPTITSTPLPTAVSPTPPPTATATAVPPPVVALPPAYPNLSGGSWVTEVHQDPAGALRQGLVKAAVVESDAGTLLWQQPLVLAVPWTMPWEGVTAVDAQHILASGDERVTVMLWEEMPPTMKALRVDGRSPTDADYPLQNRQLSLISPPDSATDTLRVALQESLPQNPTIHLTAVGDLMLSRRLGDAIVQGRLDYPFANVAPHLQRADITIGNVESAVGSGGVPVDKSYPFLAPPETAVVLAQAGFDVVSLANNHGMDYGPNTLTETLSLFAAEQIGVVGAGINATQARAPFVVEAHGMTVAIFGYVHVPVEGSGFNTQRWTATEREPGLAWADPELIMRDVTAVANSVDLIVVMLHSGYEYAPQPSPPQVAAAHAAIDAGADLVIGHHAHILQGVEFYKDGVIAYGLGNFAFDINGPPETAVLDVWLDQNGVRELRFTPAIVQIGGQPRFAFPEEATAILQNLYHLTTLLNQ